MKKPLHVLTLAAIIAHHGIEAAAGIGVPGEPYIGRRRATFLWTAVFAGNAYALTRKSRELGLLTAFANGAYQALALQHYIDWPWRLRKGVPIIQEAEELPERWLPAYNTALLVATGLSSVACLREQGPGARRAHLLGLVTLPWQLASARRHQQWLQAQ
ncbi:hypothetical protein [Propioniciclava flava]|uniref:HXXEE domain-containing protein n=1 Tax=Propioniciclava flava TaxID=2072026 RepID=A0A4Q2EIY8_9ACTN|nr:hypothetical protein [Propioniciclava flava]RXW33557.1 hypothetical protein C1706_02055 [Propioniciclava flava]